MESAMESAISVTGLAKRFGRTVAVDGVELEVPRGSVFGLLGPNGSGKTTIVRVLTTLLRPDAGVVRILGLDAVRNPAAVRRRIAVTGQFASLDDDLTGRENLTFLGRLRGLSSRAAKDRTGELLEMFDLVDAASRPVRTYSGGMRRRLDIAASLIIIPDVLFLDEPTTGLDPASRNRVWERIRSLAAAGTTVLLTTQYLDEADRLADRIAVLERGEVIAEGSPGRLKEIVGSGVLRLRTKETAGRISVDRLVAELTGEPARTHSRTGVLTARMSDPALAADAIAWLTRAGVEFESFSFGYPSLDDVFLALTERVTEDEEATEGEEARYG